MEHSHEGQATDLNLDKIQRQHQGKQGPEGSGDGMESLSDVGQGTYGGENGEQAVELDDEGIGEVGSNWLATSGVEPEELGTHGAEMSRHIGKEDREDNGQRGATQENGGLGLGDEEGLGRTGLSESGDIGAQEGVPPEDESLRAVPAYPGEQGTVMEETPTGMGAKEGMSTTRQAGESRLDAGDTGKTTNVGLGSKEGMGQTGQAGLSEEGLNYGQRDSKSNQLPIEKNQE